MNLRTTLDQALTAAFENYTAPVGVSDDAHNALRDRVASLEDQNDGNRGEIQVLHRGLQDCMATINALHAQIKTLEEHADHMACLFRQVTPDVANLTSQVERLDERLTMWAFPSFGVHADNNTRTGIAFETSMEAYLVKREGLTDDEIDAKADADFEFMESRLAAYLETWGDKEEFMSDEAVQEKISDQLRCLNYNDSFCSAVRDVVEGLTFRTEVSA